MEILKNIEEWNNLKPTLLNRYNIRFGKVNGEPNSYPCISFFFPVVDQNGYSVKGLFVGVKDAEKLIEINKELIL